MAKIEMELPNDVINKFQELDRNSDKIFGEMVEKAGEYVYQLIRANMKMVFKTTDSLEQGLIKTRVYKTPSDDGINVHIGFYGYTKGEKPVKVTTTSKSGKKYTYNRSGVPIPLIAMAREYGTSRGEAKKPFLRKSFKKKEIEAVMQSVENKYIKGDEG